MSVKIEVGLGVVKNGFLWEKLRNKIIVIFGLFGVGKLSLINYLIFDLNLWVSVVFGKLFWGWYMICYVELFELFNGGLLVDILGFN